MALPLLLTDAPDRRAQRRAYRWFRAVAQSRGLRVGHDRDGWPVIRCRWGALEWHGPGVISVYIAGKTSAERQARLAYVKARIPAMENDASDSRPGDRVLVSARYLAGLAHILGPRRRRVPYRPAPPRRRSATIPRHPGRALGHEWAGARLARGIKRALAKLPPPDAPPKRLTKNGKRWGRAPKGSTWQPPAPVQPITVAVPPQPPAPEPEPEVATVVRAYWPKPFW